MSDKTLLQTLSDIDGLGSKKAKELIEAGVRSVDDLSDEKYRKLLPTETLLSIDYPVDKKLNWDVVHSIIEYMRDNISKTIIGVGSYRRKRGILKDVDVITTLKLSTLKKKLEEFEPAERSSFEYIGAYSSGERKMSAILKFRGRYVRVDFFKITTKEKPYALLHYTGSRGFNIIVRAKAKSQGMKLNQFGLYDSKGKLIELSTERQILKKIGVTYKTPECRNE